MFRVAVRRAKETGFDPIHIHNAHGCLLSEFLLPKADMHADKYGGGHENRYRRARGYRRRSLAKS